MGLVFFLAFMRVLRDRSAAKREAVEAGIISRLLSAAVANEIEPIKVRWTDDTTQLAKVLGRALELISGETGERMVQIATLAGCERGLSVLSRSSQTIDRISVARTLRYFPGAVDILRRQATTDKSIIVRVEALLSLADLDMAAKPKKWSKWIKLGKKQPHPSIAMLLRHPGLISNDGLQHAALSDQAPLNIRMWALEALIERDGVNGQNLAIQFARTRATPSKLRALSITLINDPLALTQHFDALIEGSDWAVIVTLCRAIERTHATTLRGRVLGLALHEDWRVRTAVAVLLENMEGMPLLDQTPQYDELSNVPDTPRAVA